MYKNALVSVSNKNGLIDFIRPLAQSGTRIVSTGGTAEYLQSQGLAVVAVSEQTKFREVMDGRVKTLHPRIHMALLARADKSEDQEVLREEDLLPFDLVVGNLYPFFSKPSIENIDIGGPSFLRAAAKNYKSVTVVCDPEDYEWVLKNQLTEKDRLKLAAKVFAHTAAYDTKVAEWMNNDFETRKSLSVSGEKHKVLRYGENPHQKAVWFKDEMASGLHSADLKQGKELSYNNLLDLQAALETLMLFKEKPCCVAVKHNNPCGVAYGQTQAEAILKTIEADPISIFGGVLACNTIIDKESALALDPLFIECLMAPDITEEAAQIFSRKKNRRLLIWREMNGAQASYSLRPIFGGYLVQTKDQVATDFMPQWKIFGPTPSDEMKKNLVFAWSVAARLKSNAIAIASEGQTLGLGMGQVNRVDAVQQAIERFFLFEKNKKAHLDKTKVVLASDGFFPFADSIEKIANAGLKWIIQPGGSLQDEVVLKKAEQLGVHMVLTSQRHFWH